MPIRLALNTGPSAPGFKAHSLARLGAAKAMAAMS